MTSIRAGAIVSFALLATACTFERAVPGAALESITARDLAHDAAALAADRDSGAGYVRRRFAALGLTPGNVGSWMQDVPLVRVAVDTNAALDVRSRGVFQRFHFGRDFVQTTRRLVDTVGFWNAPMVFLGYGFPESDTANALDLRGRMVVMLADSGPPSEVFAEAARRGAIGALIVEPAGGDSASWTALVDSVVAPRVALASNARADTALAVEAWIGDSAAGKLFAQAGLDLARERMRARSPRFEPVVLQLYASTHMNVIVTRSVAHNVLAEMRGTDRAGEYVMYQAGWNAKTADARGASSVASLLSVAAAFKALGMPPSRSVVFIATVGVGDPSLGGEYYAVHPPHPLASTVADLAIVARPAASAEPGVAIAGTGTAAALEGFVDAAARDQGRTVARDSTITAPAPVAERGVPAIAVAVDSVEDVRVLFRVGYRLANARGVAGAGAAGAASGDR